MKDQINHEFLICKNTLVVKIFVQIYIFKRLTETKIMATQYFKIAKSSFTLVFKSLHIILKFVKSLMENGGF